MLNSKSWRVRLEILRRPSGRRQKVLTKVCAMVVGFALPNVRPKKYQANSIQAWDFEQLFMCHFLRPFRTNLSLIKSIVCFIKTGNAKYVKKFVRLGLSVSDRKMNS